MIKNDIDDVKNNANACCHYCVYEISNFNLASVSMKFFLKLTCCMVIMILSLLWSVNFEYHPFLLDVCSIALFAG